jgi:hypothetical protein
MFKTMDSAMRQYIMQGLKNQDDLSRISRERCLAGLELRHILKVVTA